MNKIFWQEKLQEKYKDIKAAVDEPMSKHSSFRAGGKADLLVEPLNKEQVKYVLRFAGEHGIPLTVLGNCSNVLVKDNGIRGIVMKISRMDKIHVDGNIVTCEAGALLSSLAGAALENSLAGMEFAAGIPGSVGGGVYMNAGAYDGELKDVIMAVKSLSLSGEECEWASDRLEFGYRQSVFSQNSHIITEAVFNLSVGDKAVIREKMLDYAERRRSKQPLELPSAGSTFKRPQGHFAGKLIQDAGLCGLMIGGAQVSEKHAGFIVNKENATASDILHLIEEVQKRVYENSGVKLYPEVRIIGE